MNIRMENLERLSLAELKEWMRQHRRVRCQAVEKTDAYRLLEQVLKAQHYKALKRVDKGTVRQFLSQVTGLSRAQVTRLIQRWVETAQVQKLPPRRPSFARRYTREDVALLAEVDAAHQDLSGPAIAHLLRRAWEVFGNARFERLAPLSVSHLYNLRVSDTYRRIRVRVQHTQPRQVSIGERRKPEPKGKPGYLRVDTVHQGHHDGKPGAYHINAIDTVTQWQVVGCVETISECHLIPVLEAVLHQFPFRILGFHSDNGSEFINGQVAKLLNKLLVEEFTKSRAYRTTDNALVEGKNGAVVRKHVGYGHIDASHAESWQKFYTAYMNPYLNFHRPCGFATLPTDPRGRVRRKYPHKDYRTPYEKLVSLKKWQQYLKPGIEERKLAQQAMAMSDTEAAKRMQKAKLELLQHCRTGR